MKKSLLLLSIVALLAFHFSVSAQTLLTNRQIYNFDVGDVFEYQQALINSDGISYAANNLLVTVLSKRMSSGNDTVFYTTRQRNYYRPDSANIYDTTITEILSYTELDSARQIQPYVHNSGDSFSWTIDTFNSRIENKYNYISPNPHFKPSEYQRNQYGRVEGIGEIYTYQESDGNGGSVKQLVYYKKKNNEVYGKSFFAGVEPGPLQSNAISLYPNPFKNGNVLTIADKNLSTKSLQLIDMTGRVVGCYTGNGLALKITDTHLSPGVYTIRLDGGNEIFMQKLIVVQ